MLLNKFLAALLVSGFAVGATTQAQAASALYTINFAGGSPNPTSGSFSYDPATNRFSNFVVTWNGLDFDLTERANFANPNLEVCTSYFNYLSGACGAEQRWGTAQNPGTVNFRFGTQIGAFVSLSSPFIKSPPLLLNALGSFTVTLVVPKKTLPENLACATNAINALPPSGLAPAAAKSKATMLNVVNTATTYQASRYWSLSLAAVRSALVRTDGCTLRGSPDTTGDADLITNCPAQAPIYACLKDAETQLTTPPPGK